MINLPLSSVRLSNSGPPLVGIRITCAPGREEPSPLDNTVPVKVTFCAIKAEKEKEIKNNKRYLIIR